MRLARRMWGWTSVIFLAAALAMDSFAVALAEGASGRSATPHAIKVGAVFGAAQGIMPLVGALLGMAFVSVVGGIDHWLALILLVFLGVRMLREARKSADGPSARLAGWGLLAAAFATSVDALAAGVMLPALGLSIVTASAVIGAVTAAVCTAGVLVGGLVSNRLGKSAEAAAGVVLIALGVKIFVEHQFLGG